MMVVTNTSSLKFKKCLHRILEYASDTEIMLQKGIHRPDVFSTVTIAWAIESTGKQVKTAHTHVQFPCIYKQYQFYRMFLDRSIISSICRSVPVK